MEWNVFDVLNGFSEEKLLEEIDIIVNNILSYKKYFKKKSFVDPKIVFEVLKLKEKLSDYSSRLNAFYYLQYSVNVKNTVFLSKMSVLEQKFSEYDNELMFFSFWIKSLNKSIVEKYFSYDFLKPYKRFFYNILEGKKYSLSEKEEKVINLKDISNSNSELYVLFTNSFVFDFENKKVNREELQKYILDKNPVFREKAYNVLYEKFVENDILLSEFYKYIVLDWYNENIKLRKFKSPISVRNFSNDVSDKSVNILLETVKSKSKIFTEYFKLKYSLNMKFKKDYSFDRRHLYAPFYGYDFKKYDFEFSKKKLLSLMKSFDEEFYLYAKKIFEVKHVDVFPKKDKKSGAYCYDVSKNVVPYIFLNHTDDINSLFTLFHEFGHGIHDLFSDKNIVFLKHPPLVLAETASVFSEVLLFENLLKESNDVNEKIAFLIKFLDDSYATIVRQSYFALFEIYAHENIPKGVTKENLDEYYYSLLKEQFGSMNIPSYFKHEWNLIPHIYESPFYVYSYAWGKLLVLSLFEEYKKDKKTFLEKYKRILSSGNSKNPIKLLKEEGFDVEKKSFWIKGFKILEEYINMLKKLKKEL